MQPHKITSKKVQPLLVKLCHDLKARGLSNYAVAREMSKALGRKIDEAQVRRWMAYILPDEEG